MSSKLTAIARNIHRLLNIGPFILRHCLKGRQIHLSLFGIFGAWSKNVSLQISYSFISGNMSHEKMSTSGLARFCPPPPIPPSSGHLVERYFFLLWEDPLNIRFLYFCAVISSAYNLSLGTDSLIDMCHILLIQQDFSLIESLENRRKVIKVWFQV